MGRSGGQGDSGIAADDKRAQRRSAKWPWALAIIAAAGLAVWALIDRGPDYLARYVMRTYFAGLDIDTSGIETLDIDPLRQEIAFGPVTFSGGGAEAGQVGRLRIRFDVAGMLSRRALLSSVVVEGIRIEVRQQADGAIAVNGIPLRRILEERTADEATAPPVEPKPPGATSPAWQAGLDTLNLRDSRIVFVGRRGREVTMQVDSLELRGFRTWAPDEPGTFHLNGDLNGIRIATSGTATPFAGNISFDGELSISGIEIARIEQTMGPLGFSRSAGSIDLTARSSGASLFADGRIDATLEGAVRASGFDLAHADFGTAKLGEATLDLQGVRLQQDSAGSIELGGGIDTRLAGGHFDLNDGNMIAFKAVAFRLPDMRVLLPADGTPSLSGSPGLTTQAVKINGPDMQGTIGRIEATLSGLALDVEREGFIISGPIAVDNLALVVPDSEPVSINAERARLDLLEASFLFGGGRTRLEMPMALAATNFRVSIPDVPPRPGSLVPTLTVDAAQMDARLSPLLVEYSRPAGTRIAVAAPLLTARGFRLSNPADAANSMLLASEAPRFRDVNVEVVVAQMLRVAGSAMLDAPALSVAVQGDAAGPRTELRKAAIERSSFAYEQNRHSPKPQKRRSFTMQSRVRAAQTEAALPASSGHGAIAADIAGLRVALDELRWQQTPEVKGWRVGLDLDLAKLRADLDGAGPANAELRDLAIDGLVVGSRPEYAVERVVLGNLNATITRRAATGPPQVGIPAADPTAKQATKWPPEGLPEVRIGSVSMPNGGSIALRDETLQPPFTEILRLKQFSIGAIDSTQPGSRAKVQMQAAIDGGGGNIGIDGWAAAFQAKPDFDLQARVEALSLPALSPLLAPQIGLGIINGRLDARAVGVAKNGQLEGEARATVRDLSFVDAPARDGDPLARAIGVPLNTVIDLLQDADGSIDLKVPFEGDLLSPDFDFSQVIWTGVLRVLRALIVSPFKLISASAALISASSSGTGAGEAQAAESGLPTLAPIRFTAGTSDIDSGSEEGIRTLRRLLHERPRLRLSACGVSVFRDLEAEAGSGEASRPSVQAGMQPRLRTLAEDRTLAVVRALVGDQGAAADQLRRCPEPRVLVADGGEPRAELSF